METLFLIFLLVPSSIGFIIGGCIGPKSVLERHLNDKQRSELRKLVHTKFDGSNAEKVLEEVNRYVFGHVTEDQWHSIVPELAAYQAKNHECSLYAQLLPKQLYQQLLKSVLRASEMGASKYDVKRLVDDYVERLAKTGVLPDVIDKGPIMPRVTLPEEMISSQGYRNMQPKYPKTTRGLGRKHIVHPTLVAIPENRRTNHPRKPAFPIARPSLFELSQFNFQSRINNRNSPNYRRYPENECDSYSGPCSNSF